MRLIWQSPDFTGQTLTGANVTHVGKGSYDVLGAESREAPPLAQWRAVSADLPDWLVREFIRAGRSATLWWSYADPGPRPWNPADTLDLEA